MSKDQARIEIHHLKEGLGFLSPTESMINLANKRISDLQKIIDN